MMTNVRTAMNGQFVRVGNNATMQATAIGDLTLMQGGTNKKMFLKDVMVVPNFAKNLISVGRLTDHGNAYATDKTGARLTNENEDVLNFEKGTDGMFYFFATRVKEGKEVNNVEGSNEKGSETKKKMRKEMDINEAHRKFGHATEKVVREMLKTLDIEPVGQIKTCDGCSRAKATQKRTKKVTTVTADKPAERLFMDTSGPYSETAAGNRYWFKLVDDKTRKSWDFYGARKSQLKNVLKDLLDKLRAADYTVKFIRCDNAGEHIADLKKMCEGSTVSYWSILPHILPSTTESWNECLLEMPNELWQ
ncbi:PIF1-like helicase [Fragilaria crotonensis]|nr:PIF1-like helicase [Fragilaria crotonensis]